ncbi:MAG: recombinase family protein [Dactylosporangium sp.]|nr:recombinase family protein [Dactylosporangium sp.]
MRFGENGLAGYRQASRCGAYCPVVGRVPYGYRRYEDGDETAFEPDPLTAPVVRRIFEEYLGGSGLHVIAEKLTADKVPRPSAYDAERNPHHSGSAWSKAAVRAIITNGRYVAEDLAQDLHPNCAECGRRCASRHRVPLVSAEIYRQTQTLLAVRSDSARSDRAPERRYLFRGRLRCELCQRLMQGNWNNGVAYYRCRFPREYSRAQGIDHPANVYVREHRLVEPLMGWICRSLPVHLHDWAARQPAVTRAHLVQRIRGLRGLVHEAKRDRAQSVQLYLALSLRLTYDSEKNIVHIRCEILPGAVVQDSIGI